MDRERYGRLKELYAEAIERDAEEWPDLIASLAREDEELARELASLLAAHRETVDFLASKGPREDHGRDPLLGSTIGPYRLLDRLGSGGMGVVYLAVRADGEYRRRVALKVLKPGMDSEEIVRRFRAERQILAALDHPNIARLLDGGTTDRGYPYFAMERVEGRSLDAFLAERDMPIAERLTLFLTLCDAVDFAHRNLVVHRDLKPGNVLVTAEGIPKLLDFGIARLLNPDLLGETAAATLLGGQPLTPDYASPEQLRGERATTASDIYGLGLLLYEILVGSPAFAGARGNEPERPSVAARRRDREALADGRAKKDARPSGKIDGDLDAIVLLALRPEPGERYPSVAHLAEDIRRYLDGRPVAARKGTAAYRARRFVGRHRVGVAIAAALLLSTIAFGVAMAVLALRLAKERDRAEAEREKALQVTSFLTGLFRSSDPFRTERGNPNPTARDLLARGAERVRTEFARSPEVCANLLRAIGNSYRQLGLPDEAEGLLREALRLRERRRNEDELAWAESLNDLGLVEQDRGRIDAAESLYRNALKVRLRRLGEDSPEVATVRNNLGALLNNEGRFAEAEALHRRVLEVRRRTLPPGDVQIAFSASNLGIALASQGHYVAAQEPFREAIAISRRALGAGHPRVADGLVNLALATRSAGDCRGAEPLLVEALAIQRKSLDPKHPRIGGTLNTLGYVLQCLHRPKQSKPLHLEALEILRAAWGPEHPAVAIAYLNLATADQALGDLELAEREARESVAVLRQALAPDHPDLADALEALGKVLVAKRDPGAGEVLAETAAIRKKAFKPDHPLRREAEQAIASWCAGQSAQPPLCAGEAPPLVR